MFNTDTLANIVRAIRAEAGHSLSTTQGTNLVDTLKYLAQRTQIELWTAYQWPTLQFRSDNPVTAGLRIYTFASGMSFEQVRSAWTAVTATDSFWRPLGYGVDETLNRLQVGDPPQRWDASGDTQFGIWPNPTTSNYTVRFVGQRQLTVFLNDTDMSTLDATAITLFTAAELLARAKSEDAPTKLNKAQKYLLNLLGNSVSAKRRVSTLASRAPWPGDQQRLTPYLDYIPS
jgi:hypothetical protein